MRKQLFDAGSGKLFAFVNEQLLPALKNLKNRPGATAKQKVLSEVLSGVERTRVDTETNFADILDRVHGISGESVDSTHVFTLSQVYEGLLLKMGERNSDGGQFFTPREVIRAMVKAVDPQAGETVCDPGCGTGGFLAQAYEHMRAAMGERASAAGLEQLKHRSFYGREKDNLIYPIALANLMLHGIDEPHLWHGNTLTGKTAYDGLYEGAPAHFDVVLTNPPFGGKEGADAQTNFVYKTSSTQVLFVQYVLKLLAPKGRCGIVLDEGLLFRTNEEAFVKTKRKLTDECNLWCILSLPGGAFTGAGAGVKTNLLFFTRGKPTQKIRYYDLSHIKVGKKTPLTLEHFRHFLELLPKRASAAGESEFSWTIDFAARKAQAARDAAPHHAEAERCSGEAAELREKIKALRKSDDKAKAAKIERLQTKGCRSTTDNKNGTAVRLNRE